MGSQQFKGLITLPLCVMAPRWPRKSRFCHQKPVHLPSANSKSGVQWRSYQLNPISWHVKAISSINHCWPGNLFPIAKSQNLAQASHKSRIPKCEVLEQADVACQWPRLLTAVIPLSTLPSAVQKSISSPQSETAFRPSASPTRASSSASNS